MSAQSQTNSYLGLMIPLYVSCEKLEKDVTQLEKDVTQLDKDVTKILAKHSIPKYKSVPIRFILNGTNGPPDEMNRDCISKAINTIHSKNSTLLTVLGYVHLRDADNKLLYRDIDKIRLDLERWQELKVDGFFIDEVPHFSVYCKDLNCDLISEKSMKEQVKMDFIATQEIFNKLKLVYQKLNYDTDKIVGNIGSAGVQLFYAQWFGTIVVSESNYLPLSNDGYTNTDYFSNLYSHAWKTNKENDFYGRETRAILIHTLCQTISKQKLVDAGYVAKWVYFTDDKYQYCQNKPNCDGNPWDQLTSFLELNFKAAISEEPKAQPKPNNSKSKKLLKK